MTTIVLSIPWSALASSNLRNRRRGGKAHSQAYRTSREAIHLCALDQVRGERPAFPEGELRVALRFFPPDYRHRDEANLAKGLLDGMNAVVWKDDSQIRDLSVLRVDVDEANPRCEVEVRPWRAAT